MRGLTIREQNILDAYNANNYCGAEKLKIILNRAYPYEKFNTEEIEYVIKTQLVYQLHKKQTVKRIRSHVVSYDLNDTWIIDTIVLSNLATHNNNYGYILLVLDVFSRYAYARAMRTNTANEALEMFEEIVKEAGSNPRSLISDGGSEWKGNFDKYCKNNNIHRIVIIAEYNHRPMGIIDRMCKNLREVIIKQFVVNQQTKLIMQEGNGRAIHMMDDERPFPTQRPTHMIAGPIQKQKEPEIEEPEPEIEEKQPEPEHQLITIENDKVIVELPPEEEKTIEKNTNQNIITDHRETVSLRYCNWVNYLQGFIKKYNNMPHSSIDNIEPINVANNLINIDTIRKINIEKNLENREQNKKIIEEFNIGDAVRIKLQKKHTEKGSTQTYSDEVYKIEELFGSHAVVNNEIYNLNDLQLVNTSELKNIELNNTKNILTVTKQGKAKKTVKAQLDTNTDNLELELTKPTDEPRKSTRLRKQIQYLRNEKYQKK